MYIADLFHLLGSLLSQTTLDRITVNVYKCSPHTTRYSNPMWNVHKDFEINFG